MTTGTFKFLGGKTAYLDVILQCKTNPVAAANCDKIIL